MTHPGWALVSHRHAQTSSPPLCTPRVATAALTIPAGGGTRRLAVGSAYSEGPRGAILVRGGASAHATATARDVAGRPGACPPRRRGNVIPWTARSPRGRESPPPQASIASLLRQSWGWIPPRGCHRCGGAPAALVSAPSRVETLTAERRMYAQTDPNSRHGSSLGCDSTHTPPGHSPTPVSFPASPVSRKPPSQIPTEFCFTRPPLPPAGAPPGQTAASVPTPAPACHSPPRTCGH